jgi:ribosome-associated toxin RatA of RatAB toxin-antitoxin module
VTATPLRPPFELGEMPEGRAMTTTDIAIVRAAPRAMFEIAADVARWPDHLPHYRFVKFRESDGARGGIVEMAANRPFGVADWPTWWLSEMQVDNARPAVRFRHIGGITTGMDVEWAFEPHAEGTLVRLVHVWNGPKWPVIGRFAAVAVIGPVFIHGIASRTLAGLARVAESTR